MATDFPIIPQSITVHLGAPQDKTAANVTLSFSDYIKNVASSEIYPTWPKEAIKANVLAQISFALNRVYTEFYPSQGYDFDITSSTVFDQSFVNGRDTFNTIDEVVDDVFNNYLRRPDTIEPLFTQYCDGDTVSCDGLSQWGTVPLAESGLTAFEILQRFYGDNIELVENAPVADIPDSYPNTPLQLGDSSREVEEKQIQLNRISRNYPAIPKIPVVNGSFGTATEEAVKSFQEIFGLNADGVIGKATWYKIAMVYNAVKRLSELDSEGLRADEIPALYVRELRIGDSGDFVWLVQYYLAVISAYYDTVPPLNVTGMYNDETAATVRGFQQTYGLPQTGTVDFNTWRDVYRAYRGIVENTPPLEGGTLLYPGLQLRYGSRSEYVSALQTYINTIAQTYTSIPTLPVTGFYGRQTEAAVRAVQSLFGLTVTGSVDPFTWATITSLYSDLSLGNARLDGQAPGFTVS
ncbi:MAG: peptidoglycan-binding protein [Clostridia bacterium]|nr:peptidoglycan-binding protein [Clostridia bacterium]